MCRLVPTVLRGHLCPEFDRFDILPTLLINIRAKCIPAVWLQITTKETLTRLCSPKMTASLLLPTYLNYPTATPTRATNSSKNCK